VDFDELFARERWTVLRERHRQAIGTRWLTVLLSFGISAAGDLAGALQITIVQAGALAGIAAALNLAATVAQRRGRFAPWHFWTMVSIDVLTVTVLVYFLGPHGYLLLPFLVFVVGAYALGLPTAARVLLAESVIAYPVARLAAAGWQSGTAAPVVALETLFLLGSGWLAMQGPLAYTRRLRRVRGTWTTSASCPCPSTPCRRRWARWYARSRSTPPRSPPCPTRWPPPPPGCRTPRG
jgi:hypothetical protein